MYGRIVDGVFVKAPNSIDNDFNLTAEKLLAAGYLPVVEEAPNPPEGQEPFSREHVEEDGKIILRWTYHAPVKVTRVFSKLRAVEALMELGVWSEVKSWIEENGLYDLYLAAVEFTEDDERFKSGVESLKSELGLSDEQVEDLLSRCVKEGTI